MRHERYFTLGGGLCQVFFVKVFFVEEKCVLYSNLRTGYATLTKPISYDIVDGAHNYRKGWADE